MYTSQTKWDLSDEEKKSIEQRLRDKQVSFACQICKCGTEVIMNVSSGPDSVLGRTVWFDKDPGIYVNLVCSHCGAIRQHCIRQKIK